MADLSTRLTMNSSQFDRSIKQSTLQIHKFKNVTEAVGRSVAAFTAKFQLISDAYRLLKSGTVDIINTNKEFEKSMSQFQGILGVAKEEMKYFEREAIRMGGATTQTASQVAEAFKNIGARLPQLLNTKQGLVQVTEASIVLAEAAGVDVAEAGKALADSINQMGASSSEAIKYVNVLAAGSRNGAGDITYLNGALEKVGGIAATAGLSFEQLVAVIETIAPKVTNAESAGIQLRQVFLALEKTNDSKIKPSLVGLEAALEELGRRELTLADYTKIFDQRAVVVAKTLVDNRNKLKELTNAVTDTNTAFEQAKINTDNMAGAIVRLDSAWEDFTLTVIGFSWKDFIDGSAKILTNLTEIYLKMTNIDAYNKRMASKELGKNWHYVQGRVEQKIENYTHNPNPNKSPNYTEEEATKYIQNNAKAFVKDYDKVIDKLKNTVNPNTKSNYTDNEAKEYVKENIKTLVKDFQKIVNGFKTVPNPEKAQNYTRKEAAQYVKDNYKTMFPDLGLDKIDNDYKVGLADNIENYLDGEINRIETISEKEKQRNKELKEEEELLQLMNLDRDEYLKKVIEIKKEQLAYAKNPVERVAISSEIEKLQAELKQRKKNGSSSTTPKDTKPKMTEEQEVQFGVDNWLNMEMKGLNDNKLKRAAEGLDPVTIHVVPEFEEEVLEQSIDDYIEEQEDIHKKMKMDKAAKMDIEINGIQDACAGFANLADSIGGFEGASEGLRSSMAILSTAAAIAALIAGMVQKANTTTLTIWDWIAGITAGTAAVVTVASQLKSINKFALGGIVNSPYTTGDRNIIAVNGGEMILNRGQQANLFRLLDGETTPNNNTKQIVFKLKGSDIYGSLQNYNKKLNKIK